MEKIYEEHYADDLDKRRFLDLKRIQKLPKPFQYFLYESGKIARLYQKEIFIADDEKVVYMINDYALCKGKDKLFLKYSKSNSCVYKYSRKGRSTSRFSTWGGMNLKTIRFNKRALLRIAEEVNPSCIELLNKLYDKHKFMLTNMITNGAMGNILSGNITSIYGLMEYYVKYSLRLKIDEDNILTLFDHYRNQGVYEINLLLRNVDDPNIIIEKLSDNDFSVKCKHAVKLALYTGEKVCINTLIIDEKRELDRLKKKSFWAADCLNLWDGGPSLHLNRNKSKKLSSDDWMTDDIPF